MSEKRRSGVVFGGQSIPSNGESQARCISLLPVAETFDSCTTVKLNRPRSISAEIITALPPSPYPPLDRLQTYDNIYFQIAYSRLIKILDQIADLGYV
jgi:hypothetical protein